MNGIEAYQHAHRSGQRIAAQAHAREQQRAELVYCAAGAFAVAVSLVWALRAVGVWS